MAMTRRSAERLAWSLAVLAGAILVPAVVFLVLSWSEPIPPGAFGFKGFALFFSLMLMVVGFLIATRRPANPIGWLCLAGAIGSAVQELTFDYALYAQSQGMTQAGRYAAWVNSWIWIVSLTALTAMTLLFPDGRLRSSRWRSALWGTVVAGTIASISTALYPGPITGFATVQNPFGMGSRVTIAAVGSIATAVWGVCFLSAGACAWLRYRSATGEERAQLRWFVTFGPITAVLLVVNFAIQGLFGERSPAYLLSSIVVVIAMGAFIASLAVAILRYRLFEIDVVIKKTVIFATIVVAVTAFYLFVAVFLPAAVVGLGSGIQTWAVLIGVAIGLLIIPLRNRARRFADRLVYGKRATPYEVLEEFSGRMSEVYATDDVLPRMARILGEAVGAERAQVWLRIGGELRPAGRWPGEGTGPVPVRLKDGGIPPLAGDLAVPVLHQGELLGALEVAMPANDPMNPERERLAHGLASQAGLVLRNARLIEELRASRQRLVAAQDEERRKIERNIHDGAQQQLVALAVKQRLAASLIGKDDAAAQRMLEELQTQTNDALEDLRDLARGIYPPLLADKGLVAALDSQARKAAVPVTISADGIGRFDQNAEAAVYFCCLEALQNVGKYAEAKQVWITLRNGDGRLAFEVSDDGEGFDTGSTSYGTGLQGMADRLAALDGTLQITSAPGEGTTVAGSLLAIPVGDTP